MKWKADRYVDQMSFKTHEKPFFAELFGPLLGLEKEWLDQGATPQEASLRAYGLDHLGVHHIGVHTGMRGGETQVLEDTEIHRITRDAYGRRQKLIKSSATIPLPMDFPVEGARDWEESFRDRYTWHGDRVEEGWLKAAKDARGEGQLLVLHVLGAYNEVRQLMGDEEACVVGYEDPELLQDMLGVMADTACRAIAEVSRHIVVDQVPVHEDMAGKSGPLWGSSQMSEYAVPYYRRIRDEMDRAGIPLFGMDSDGDMTPIIDQLLEGGINVLHPMEPTGQLDAVRVREKYGHRLAFKGGIDKFAVGKGPKAIRAEIERVVLPLKDEMGVVFSLDHRIPTGTPLAHYRSYIEQMRDALELEDLEPGWGRMAF